MPQQAIISGFKGTIDFYYWNGIACARKWPRSPGHNRTPAVQAGWAAFAWAAKNWTTIDNETREAFNRMAAGTNLTGRDMFVKSYISSAHLHNLP